MPGRVVPAEVRDLCSITGGGTGAWGDEIVASDRLPTVNDEADEDALTHDTAGGARLNLRAFDDRTIGKAYDICHRHSCSLSATGIWGSRD